MYSTNEKSAPATQTEAPSPNFKAYYKAQSKKYDIQNTITCQELAEKICAALGGKKIKENEWMCHCPCHDDQNPSLHISIKQGKNGDIPVIYCFAGCDPWDIIATLKERGLWYSFNGKKNEKNDIPKYWPPNPDQPQKELIKKWYYIHPLRDAMIGIVGRYEDRTGNKDVIPFFQKNGNGSFYAGLGEYSNKRPWYIRGEGKKLIIVEGEKCVDAITTHIKNVMAATWQGGSNAADKADFELLEEVIQKRQIKTIYLWPDADLPGIKAIQTVYQKLKEIEHIEIKLIDPLCLLYSPGHDAADLFEKEEKISFDDLFFFHKPEEEFDRITKEAEISELRKKYYLLEKISSEDKKAKYEAIEIKEKLKEKWVAYMNMKYAYVYESESKVIILSRRKNQLTTTKDMKSFYANVKLPFDPVSTWLNSPERKVYFGLHLARTEKRDNTYNLFKGWATEPKAQPCDHFLKFIYEVICSKNQRIYEWLLDWLAHMLQMPEKKQESSVAVVLKGKKGTGKTFFAEKILELTGSYGIKIDQPELLFGRFKEHLMNIVYCLIDEAFWQGDKKWESQLKSFITSDQNLIEGKGKKPVMIQNYMRFLFTSNENWIVPVTKDERRFTVLEVSDSKRMNFQYFQMVNEAWENGEREGFLHFLLNRKITHNLKEPIWTNALIEQLEESFEPHQNWILEAIVHGEFQKDDQIYSWAKNERLKIPVKTFYDCYLDYCKKLNIKKVLSKRILLREVERFLGVKFEKDRDEKTRFYLLPSLNILRNLETIHDIIQKYIQTQTKSNISNINIKSDVNIKLQQNFYKELGSLPFELFQFYNLLNEEEKAYVNDMYFWGKDRSKNISLADILKDFKNHTVRNKNPLPYLSQFFKERI